MAGESRVTPLASSQSGEARQSPAGAVAAFANTVPHYNNVIFGPPPSSRSQAVGDYREALDKGYKVKALVLETFGGFSPVLLQWFKAVAAVRQDRLTSSQSMDATWTQVSYTAYHSQRISVTLMHEVAREILNQVDQLEEPTALRRTRRL